MNTKETDNERATTSEHTKCLLREWLYRADLTHHTDDAARNSFSLHPHQRRHRSSVQVEAHHAVSAYALSTHPNERTVFHIRRWGMDNELWPDWTLRKPGS